MHAPLVNEPPWCISELFPKSKCKSLSGIWCLLFKRSHRRRFLDKTLTLCFSKIPDFCVKDHKAYQVVLHAGGVNSEHRCNVAVVIQLKSSLIQFRLSKMTPPTVRGKNNSLEQKRAEKIPAVVPKEAFPFGRAMALQIERHNWGCESSARKKARTHVAMNSHYDSYLSSLCPTHI